MNQRGLPAGRRGRRAAGRCPRSPPAGHRAGRPVRARALDALRCRHPDCDLLAGADHDAAELGGGEAGRRHVAEPALGPSRAGIGGTEYAIRELLREADAGVYVLDSIDEAAAPALRQAGRTILSSRLRRSRWPACERVARAHPRPPDRHARPIAGRHDPSRGFDKPLAQCGSSLEIDALPAPSTT